MKRLLLASTLLLSACAPFLQTVQGEQASLARDGQSILFKNPGPDTAEAPALLIVGTDLSISDSRCTRRASGAVGCVLPDTPAGQQFRLPFTGKVSTASLTFYRASKGARPVYLELP